MSITSIEFSQMTSIEKYQRFARRKFQEVENKYYAITDELESKLQDIDEIDGRGIPDFTLHTFSFLKDWQIGKIDSECVLSLLKGMNFSDVADKQITRRINNFMIGKEQKHPQSYEYLRGAKELLRRDVVPIYENYLKMINMYFSKMNDIDKQQVKLSWIEQVVNDKGDVHNNVKTVTLNQAFRELDTHVIPNNTNKYIMGDNVIVFDEDLHNGNLLIHWIFAPKSYIIKLRDQFKVKKTMSFMEDKEYLKKLVGNFIK